MCQVTCTRELIQCAGLENIVIESSIRLQQSFLQQVFFAEKIDWEK